MNHPKYIEIPEYWDNRYSENNDTWSLNNATPAFVQYLNEIKLDAGKKLLVLGSGKGHDAIHAAQNGYNVCGIDFSQKAIDNSIKLAKEAKVEAEFLKMDIFEIERLKRKFDIIYEYATFCSIIPERIPELIEKIHHVLDDKGLFVTILFPIKELNYNPPFAVNLKYFYSIMRKYFKLIYLQKNINSIKPRRDNEILLVFKRG